MWRRLLQRLGGPKSPSTLEDLEEAFGKKLEHMSSSLARLSAVVKRLEVKLESSSKRARELEKRGKTYRRVGREQLAVELDRELLRLEREIGGDKKELESARALYSIHLRKIDTIRSRFRERAHELERLKDQTALKELQIEIDAALKDASREVEHFLEQAKSLEADWGAHHDQVAAKARVSRDLAELDLNRKATPKDE